MTSQPAKFIEYLLQCRADLALVHPEVLTEEDELGDPGGEREQYRRQMAAAGISTVHADLINRCFSFWIALPDGLADDVRLRYADEMLKCLNEGFSSRPVGWLPGVRGGVAVGRRWWVAVAEHMRRSLPVEHQRSPFSAFPSLRVLTAQVTIASHYSVHSAFAQLANRSTMRVACDALSGAQRTTFVGTTRVTGPRSGRFGIRATHVGPPEDAAPPQAAEVTYIDELGATLARARADGVQVLLLPELSVCPKGRAFISQELKRDPGELLLVVPGSFHVDAPQPGRHVNAAPLWVVERVADTKDVRVSEQVVANKSEVFDVAIDGVEGTPGLLQVVQAARANGCDALAEDIVPSVRSHLLNTPCGLFLVLICRDLLTAPPEGHLALAMGSADHVLAPALSSSPKAWFVAAAQQASRRGTAVYVANAAQALSTDGPAAIELAGVATPLPIQANGGAPALATFGYRSSALPADTELVRYVQMDQWFVCEIPVPVALRRKV